VRRRGTRLAAALAAALLPAAALAANEPRRVESLGVAPADASTLEGRAPRDAALEDALGRAVLSVAIELFEAVGQDARSDPGPPPD
jgi:hypothetical protein